MVCEVYQDVEEYRTVVEYSDKNRKHFCNMQGYNCSNCWRIKCEENVNHTEVKKSVS